MRRGFTLKELIIVIVAIFVISFGFIGTGFMGNCWFTKDGVQNELQINNANAKVLKIERNVFAYSIVTFKMDEDKPKETCLDSSIFFNYEFMDCN